VSYKIKRFVAKLLKSKLLGAIIGSVYGNRIPFYESVIHTDHPILDNSVKAALFWRLYESSEVRYVYDLMSKNLPVIELGSSIGVVSSQIAKINRELLICVEANPDYQDIIRANLSANGKSNYRLYQAAIGDGQNRALWYKPSKINTGGKLNETYSEGSIKVPIMKLSTIIKENEIKEYVLVCDIEGSEIDILLNDPHSLDSCRQIIIELHLTNCQGQVYEVKDVNQIILDMGFCLVKAHGATRVYEK